jgi:hypothetical protein
MTKVKVWEKVKDHWVKVMAHMYQVKGIARRNTHVKYESPTTYQSKVMTKVKILEKVKDQWVNVMVSNERSSQKEYTCEM